MTGSVGLLIGDNLAIHQVGGLTESFGKVQKVSRYCHCSYADIQSSRTVKNCRLRTKEEYNRVSEVLKSKGFPEKLCLKEGIRSVCVLNELRNFNIVESSPPDIAHDLHEGVVPVVVSAVLTDLVKRKLVRLEGVNQSIKSSEFFGVFRVVSEHLCETKIPLPLTLP